MFDTYPCVTYRTLNKISQHKPKVGQGRKFSKIVTKLQMFR